MLPACLPACMHACMHAGLVACHCTERIKYSLVQPSPTTSPTDPVPRGLLTLCPAAY